MTEQVTLLQMLDARDRRVCRQQELLNQYQKPLLCFTMNIPGPVKNSPLIRRGFEIGKEDFCRQLLRMKTTYIYMEEIHEITGNEAFYVVDMEPLSLKKLTAQLEDFDELGRLYDMDILLPPDSENPFGRKVDRSEIGLLARPCLICGKPGKECASRRLHTVEELQKKTAAILKDAVFRRDSSQIAQLAIQSLLFEVNTTPKPGLVDRLNCGSHKDMDIFTFMRSCAALWPYFEKCAQIGLKSAEEGLTARETFQNLRIPGQMAENRMLAATHGVNTHKGAIFSLGILCAAAGRLPYKDRGKPEEILKECAAMTQGLVETDFAGLTKENARTIGQKLFLSHGITGVRGQIESGLPAVLSYGLPTLETLLHGGKSYDEAGAAALLALMAHTTDTNLIARSDVPTQQAAAKEAELLLKEQECPGLDSLLALDKEFIKKNLSPGGSADLLAICYFLHFLREQETPVSK